MALDKLTSDMITAGAVNAAAIADGTVVAAEIADDAIVTAKIADDAVTTAKIPNSAITDAKIAAVAASKLSGTVADARFPATLPAASGVNLTALNATQVTSGTLPDARFPATLPATSAANLTSIPAGNLTGTVADARISALTASKLTGNLPAISGASLTGISANDNTPRFVAYAGSVSQSLTNNTWTKSTWQGGVGMIDTDSAWDLTNHKFVIPSGEAGDYYFETQTSFYSSDNCLRYPNVAIYKNGSAMAWGYHGGFHTSSQAWRHGSAVMSTVETMAVGDYIEMYVRAEVFSGSISINTGSNKKFHYIMGWKLA